MEASRIRAKPLVVHTKRLIIACTEDLELKLKFQSTDNLIFAGKNIIYSKLSCACAAAVLAPSKSKACVL